jgi:hypothetical protein
MLLPKIDDRCQGSRAADATGLAICEVHPVSLYESFLEQLQTSERSTCAGAAQTAANGYFKRFTQYDNMSAMVRLGGMDGVQPISLCIFA